MELTEREIDLLVDRMAKAVIRKLKGISGENEQSMDMVSVKQAANILGISPGRMREIKDKFPYVKLGDSKQSRVLFVKSGLLQPYK